MEHFTKLIDTDLLIFSLLDYLTILNLKEVCKYFYEILQLNSFWRDYLYNGLIQKNIKPQLLEKYRPQLEPYNISCRNYYVTDSIEQAMKDGRMDSIVFLGVYGLRPGEIDVQAACHDCNIKALKFFNDEYGLLSTKNIPIGRRCGDETYKIKKHKRNKDLKEHNTFTYTKQYTEGSSGPPPPPFTCHALPRLNKDDKSFGHHVFEIALMQGDTELLDWLYNKNLSPPDYIDTWRYPYRSVEWLKCINERDELGWEFVNEGPYN